MNELVKVENNEIVISEDFREKLINFEKLKKEIDYQSDLLKSELVELMPKLGKDKILLDGLAISYRKGTTRKSFDSKAFQVDHPEEYDKYIKESEVSPSITIKVGD